MSTCRSCGREILWAETQHGKKVPLDTKALVFSVVQEGSKFIAVKPTGGVIGERFMVSHFATCLDANQWSKHTGTDQADRHFSEPKESGQVLAKALVLFFFIMVIFVFFGCATPQYMDGTRAALVPTPCGQDNCGKAPG